MDLREGFLAVIAAAPDDDVPRLIFADWLDEQDDPLAEFIRLQIALEPLRRPCPDPLAELERVRRLNRIPPGEEHGRHDWPLARQLDREDELLQEHRETWLGEVAGLEDDHLAHFDPEFRRGLVASAQIGLTALGKHAEAIRRACPALQRLIVFGTRGRGEQLAACRALAGLPELLLAGWLLPTDAAALAGSPYLAGLRSLTVWIGPYDGFDASLAMELPPGLRDLTLVQMCGGLAADERGLDRRADALAERVRRQRPGLEVRVERPCNRLFPLDGVHIGCGLDAGHLPGGQPVLVDEGQEPLVMYFDAEGHFQREERLDMRYKLLKPPKHEWEDVNVKELLKVLRREIGFVPGPIFVHEFASESCDIGVRCWDMHLKELAGPRTTDPEKSEDIGRHLYWWLSTHQFLLPFGNSYRADGLGRVHSS